MALLEQIEGRVIQLDKMADSLNVMQISHNEKSQQLMIIIKQQKNLWKCIKKSHKDIQQTSDNEHDRNGCEEEKEKMEVRARKRMS